LVLYEDKRSKKKIRYTVQELKRLRCESFYGEGANEKKAPESPTPKDKKSGVPPAENISFIDFMAKYGSVEDRSKMVDELVSLSGAIDDIKKLEDESTMYSLKADGLRMQVHYSLALAEEGEEKFNAITKMLRIGDQIRVRGFPGFYKEAALQLCATKLTIVSRADDPKTHKTSGLNFGLGKSNYVSFSDFINMYDPLEAGVKSDAVVYLAGIIDNSRGKDDLIHYYIKGDGLKRQIQVVYSLADSEEGEEVFREVNNMLRCGDLIGIVGHPGKAKSNVLSIYPKKIALLSRKEDLQLPPPNFHPSMASPMYGAGMYPMFPPPDRPFPAPPMSPGPGEAHMPPFYPPPYPFPPGMPPPEFFGRWGGAWSPMPPWGSPVKPGMPGWKGKPSGEEESSPLPRTSSDIGFGREDGSPSRNKTQINYSLARSPDGSKGFKLKRTFSGNDFSLSQPHTSEDQDGGQVATSAVENSQAPASPSNKKDPEQSVSEQLSKVSLEAPSTPEKQSFPPEVDHPNASDSSGHPDAPEQPAPETSTQPPNPYEESDSFRSADQPAAQPQPLMTIQFGTNPQGHEPPNSPVVVFPQFRDGAPQQQQQNEALLQQFMQAKRGEGAFPGQAPGFLPLQQQASQLAQQAQLLLQRNMIHQAYLQQQQLFSRAQLQARQSSLQSGAAQQGSPNPLHAAQAFAAAQQKGYAVPLGAMMYPGASFLGPVPQQASSSAVSRQQKSQADQKQQSHQLIPSQLLVKLGQQAPIQAPNSASSQNAQPPPSVPQQLINQYCMPMPSPIQSQSSYKPSSATGPGNSASSPAVTANLPPRLQHAQRGSPSLKFIPAPGPVPNGSTNVPPRMYHQHTPELSPHTGPTTPQGGPIGHSRQPHPASFSMLPPAIMRPSQQTNPYMSMQQSSPQFDGARQGSGGAPGSNQQALHVLNAQRVGPQGGPFAVQIGQQQQPQKSGGASGTASGFLTDQLAQNASESGPTIIMPAPQTQPVWPASHPLYGVQSGGADKAQQAIGAQQSGGSRLQYVPLPSFQRLSPGEEESHPEKVNVDEACS